MWWLRSEQTNRNASWYAMNGVTNMVGSLLAWGLGHISSHVLHSYQVWPHKNSKWVIHAILRLADYLLVLWSCHCRVFHDSLVSRVPRVTASLTDPANQPLPSRFSC